MIISVNLRIFVILKLTGKPQVFLIFRIIVSSDVCPIIWKFLTVLIRAKVFSLIVNPSTLPVPSPDGPKPSLEAPKGAPPLGAPIPPPGGSPPAPGLSTPPVPGGGLPGGPIGSPPGAPGSPSTPNSPNGQKKKPSILFLFFD